jgi:hypothetical protein
LGIVENKTKGEETMPKKIDRKKSASLDLKKIREAIKKTGAKWTAGETAITRLAPEIRAGLLSPTPFGPVVKAKPLPATLPPLSASFDWTNVDGNNFVTSVKMQFGGTCTAFASAAALESCALQSGLLQGIDIDLSEHAICSCPNGGVGNLHAIAAFMESTGLPAEAWFPSDLDSAHPGWQFQTCKVANWDCFYPTRVEEVKTLLVLNGPVVTTMNCPLDFFAYIGGVYSNTSYTSGDFHAVLVVGYDDHNQCFKVKNSWGKDWGEKGSDRDEKGYFRIAYGEFKSATVNFGWDIHTYSGALLTSPSMVPVAMKTVDGHYVTVVNGGGLGGPNNGPNAVAIHTDATKFGPWETFHMEWVDSTHFALKTVNGNYVTAVNGGGIGGPNNAASPVHTDATKAGPWERLILTYNPATKTVTFRTLNGQYLTAVNGGGFGGPNNVPIHTDARSLGPWETFSVELVK